MTNSVEYKDKLSDLIPERKFKLDGRGALAHLQAIHNYARHIPYGIDSSDEEISNWADYFFQGGEIEELGEIYADMSLSQGVLLPHKAFLLAVLKMLEIPKALMNSYPHMHQDLYYRELLKLKEHVGKPSKVAVSINLEESCAEQMLPEGTLLDAGQDQDGNYIHFSLDNDVHLNHCDLKEIRFCYPSPNEVDGVVFTATYQMDRDWPDTGCRIFEPVKHDTATYNSRILVSSALTSTSGQAQEIEIFLSENIKFDDVSAYISGDGEWHTLNLVRCDENSATFQIPSDIDITGPDGLSNLNFDSPVILFSRGDNVIFPDVIEISVDKKLLEYEQYCTRILTPFGHSETAIDIHNMELYLGIDKINPGQTISLFWNVNSPQPLNTTWKYLTADNNWGSLDESLFDETNGLLKSGLWSAVLPEDASTTASSMPSGYYWIKCEIEPVADNFHVARYPWLNGILTNAATATLQKGDGLDRPSTSFVPAETIRHLVYDKTGVVAVDQPWPSWGGVEPEATTSFFKRVAQRLAHRNRALTWPDIIMLLKTMFPEIHEVIIPSSNRLSAIPALTTQKIIVIPFYKDKDNDDPLRPVFNAARLMTMQNALKNKASLWQNIEVSNPCYRNVNLCYQVSFRKGVNSAWAEKSLRNEITACYMPWSVGSTAGATTGNRIDYYEVIATIQNQSYVDHVVSLSLDGQQSSIQGMDDEVLILCWP